VFVFKHNFDHLKHKKKNLETIIIEDQECNYEKAFILTIFNMKITDFEMQKQINLKQVLLDEIEKIMNPEISE